MLTLKGVGLQMKKSTLFIRCIVIILMIMATIPRSGIAAESKEDVQESFKLPENIIDISKNNTYPNVPENYEVTEPSTLTKELIAPLEIPIENPNLIKLLNETTIKPSVIAFGYRGAIYLGRWPLHYESENTAVTWDYQLINTNKIDNSAGESVQEIRYIQTEEKVVQGALSNKVDHGDIIREMMLEKTKKHTGLPLAFKTVVGSNSKLNNYYNVPVNKVGNLQAYIPAMNEKGNVTFGEVYIELKGSKKSVVIKNVTKQGIGAWIPIQDHVSFSYQLK